MSPLSQEKILVTGVAGFVGSHLAETVVRLGSPVIGIDNLSRGNVKNIHQLQQKKNFSFAKGDILDKDFLQDYMRGVDIVFHEAALIDVNESMRLPTLYRENNVVGFQNILEAARINDVRRLVFASSCAVYGVRSILPIKEDVVLRPLSPYAETKVQGEELCAKYSKDHGISCVTLRYFNIYGPGQTWSPYSGVILKFIEQARHNQPLTIYGTGTQTRDFIYIDDIITANLLAATEPQVEGEPFNIGSGKQTTINDLATTILTISGNPHLQILHAPQRTGDILYSQANLEKAQRLLHFQPHQTLLAGLTATYQSL